jgi:hypothetical protein
VRASRAFGKWRQFVASNPPPPSSILAIIVDVTTMTHRFEGRHQKRRQKRLACGVDSIAPLQKRLDRVDVRTFCCGRQAALDLFLKLD